MHTESEEIDSENWLFDAKLKECRDSIPNLISSRQFNDRRKAKEMDSSEDCFSMDSKQLRYSIYLVENATK